jgi:hypothetical protein
MRNAPARGMARRARARARKQNLGERAALSWSLENPAESFERLNNDLDAQIRLLRNDDATAELLRSVLNVDNAGVPGALIEPLRNVLVAHGDGSYDFRLAIATKMGFPIPGPVSPLVAAGWTLGPRQGKWQLTDPTGTLIARCEVVTRDIAAEPAWTAQAVAASQILIAYGTRVGVRIPDGVPSIRYDDQYRAAELHKSLASLQACAAIVKISQQIGGTQSA